MISVGFVSASVNDKSGKEESDEASSNLVCRSFSEDSHKNSKLGRAILLTSCQEYYEHLKRLDVDDVHESALPWLQFVDADTNENDTYSLEDDDDDLDQADIDTDDCILKVGDKVNVRWDDGESYPGKIQKGKT